MALESAQVLGVIAENIDKTTESTLSDVSNVLADDSNYCEWFESGSGGTSIGEGGRIKCDALRVRNFRVNIPKSAKVQGIEVEVKREDGQAWIGITAGVVYDRFSSIDAGSGVNIVLNGVKIGDTKENNGWSNSGTEVITYGSSVDDWNTELTGADLASSGFGVEIRPVLERGEFGVVPRARIYYVKVKVYYDTEADDKVTLNQENKRSRKNVHYKFYDKSGNYVTSLTQDDFKYYPQFSMNINGGLSMMSLETVHSFNDLRYPSSGQITKAGETINTVKGLDRFKNAMQFGNLVKIFISDKDGLNIPIYSGYVGGYDYRKSNNARESLVFEILPNITRLDAFIHKDESDNTTISYNSEDPSEIAKDIILSIPTDLDFTTDTIKNTGLSRTYQFISQTARDAVQKVIDLCPYGWFYYVGEDDKFYLKNFLNSDHTTTHRVPENSISNITITKSIYTMRNRVFFLGGGEPQLYVKNEKRGSQSAYGIFEELMTDERVTDETSADSISNRFLNENSKPTASVIIDLMDNNFTEENGMDIENFKVGDRIIINTNNFDNSESIWGQMIWGQDLWGYDLIEYGGIPFYIQSYEYNYDRITLNCSFQLPRVQNRIEDINRDLTEYRFRNAPSSPS